MTGQSVILKTGFPDTWHNPLNIFLSETQTVYIFLSETQTVYIFLTTTAFFIILSQFMKSDLKSSHPLLN